MHRPEEYYDPIGIARINRKIRRNKQKKLFQWYMLPLVLITVAGVGRFLYQISQY